MASLTTGRSSLRDVVVEAVNARDPDLLTLAYGVHFPPEMMDTLLELMDRSSGLMLSRGALDGEPVAAIWVPDTDGLYGPGGHLELWIDGATARLKLIPGRRPGLVCEAPPALDVADWGRADLLGHGPLA